MQPSSIRINGFQKYMFETPISRYQRDLSEQKIVPDSAQAEAVRHLQRLFDQLLERRDQRWTSWLSRIAMKVGLRKPPSPLEGIYMWGGVGRGKTYLMDIFYDCLPFDQKLRTHFHRFMRQLHAEMRQLKNRQDPLETVAENLSRKTSVICFDEFFVVDIADAMILANLFTALFARGVTLVATSNIPPDQLYRDGLQRGRFLPAIALLNRHTQVFNLDGGIDYRLRALEQAPLYHWPCGSEAETALARCFVNLAPDAVSIQADVQIEVEGRCLRAKKEADDVVWFEFAALCDGPRSQNDYIELAREYHAVLVSNVPELGEAIDDQARRFIYLVDEFYDRGVKLVISAAKPIEKLYGEGRLAFEFQRTISRLLEMQSQEYLARAHRA
jgi:cell division protein ZapE